MNILDLCNYRLSQLDIHTRRTGDTNAHSTSHEYYQHTTINHQALMTTHETLRMPLNTRSAVPTHRYLTRDTILNATSPSPESELLKSIRSALRGSRRGTESFVTSLTFVASNESTGEEMRGLITADRARPEPRFRHPGTKDT